MTSGSAEPGCELDHLVLGVATLAAADHYLGDARSALLPGGSHPGRGTCNTLIPSAGGTYLEFLAPDPAQRSGATIPAFLATLPEPAFCWWSLRVADMRHTQEVLSAAGIVAGRIIDGSRVTTRGDLIRWQLLLPTDAALGNSLPFFIHWGDGPHPSHTPTTAGAITQLDLISPDPDRLSALLATLGFDDSRVRIGSPTSSKGTTRDGMAQSTAKARINNTDLSFHAPGVTVPSLS